MSYYSDYINEGASPEDGDEYPLFSRTVTRTARIQHRNEWYTIEAGEEYSYTVEMWLNEDGEKVLTESKILTNKNLHRERIAIFNQQKREKNALYWSSLRNSWDARGIKDPLPVTDLGSDPDEYSDYINLTEQAYFWEQEYKNNTEHEAWGY